MARDEEPSWLDGDFPNDSQTGRWHAGQWKVTNLARCNTLLQPCATGAVRSLSMRFLLKTLLALGFGLATAALL